MMYKLSVVLVCVAVIHTNGFTTYKRQQLIHFPKEAGDFILSVVRKCASESSLPVFSKLVREGKYREDDEFKNFIHCSFKKSGYAFDDGRVNIELSAPLYPDPAAMLEVMKECDKKRGSTAVNNTFQFFKCFQERSPFLIGLSI